MVWISISLMTSTLSIFSCVVGQMYIIFGCLSKSITYFWIRMLFWGDVLLLSSKSSSYTLDTRLLVNIFSPSVGCLFSYLMMSLKSFNLGYLGGSVNWALDLGFGSGHPLRVVKLSPMSRYTLRGEGEGVCSRFSSSPSRLLFLK